VATPRRPLRFGSGGRGGGIADLEGATALARGRSYGGGRGDDDV